MSKTSAEQAAARDRDHATRAARDNAARAEQVRGDRKLHGVVLERRGLGHRVVYVEIPESVARKYAVREEPAEIKAIVLERLAHWLAGVP
jgi:hypothetical protein